MFCGRRQARQTYYERNLQRTEEQARWRRHMDWPARRGVTRLLCLACTQRALRRLLPAKFFICAGAPTSRTVLPLYTLLPPLHALP